MRKWFEPNASSRTSWTCSGMWCVMLLALVLSVDSTERVLAQSDAESILIEDFNQPDENGFPKEWDAQRSKVTAQETYVIGQEDGMSFLNSQNSSQRVYTKNMSWDPKTHPILTWRWRVRSVEKGAEFIAAVYPSLDVDLMFIPVNTKYVWSVSQPVGTTKEGGMFGSTEVVIRSGAEQTGEWVEERINVYEDFKGIHEHEPAPKAWGISLLGGPGVEVDFGSLAVHPK
ncbi:DUF3047 domain-containing protein [Candidatus Nitrospira salsa]|nr:MAG: hypothetical protein NPIRA01_29720 [Nitrospirales bacterium]